MRGGALIPRILASRSGSVLFGMRCRFRFMRGRGGRDPSRWSVERARARRLRRARGAGGREPFTTTPLAGYDTTAVAVVRGSFCETVDDRQVEAALGASADASSSWQNGDTIEVGERHGGRRPRVRL